jgi:hypothetical protein
MDREVQEQPPSVSGQGWWQKDDEHQGDEQDDGTTLAGLRWLYTASHAGE